MRFTKMHGIGNDYIFVNCFEEIVQDPSRQALVMSRPHFGVGADGLVLLERSETADFGMRIFNADGSEAEMCGNGIRCLAKHVYDFGHKKEDRMTIETLAGIMNIRLDIDEGKAVAATVEMGAPRLERKEVPVIGQGRFIDQPIEVEGKVLHGTAVSMGNPHLMIFDELSDQEVERLGPAVHAHPLFPRRTNVEFVKSVNGILEVRVYERGAGWTMACGTGACATAVAAGLLGKVPFGEEVQVRLPGGSLWIKVSQDLSMVTMRGPAALVFEGRM